MWALVGRRVIAGRVIALVSIGVLLAGCGGGSEVKSDAPTGITVTSTAFAADQPIPATYSCRGENVSPPLAWTGVPDGAREIALVVDDPDAPNGTFTHWVLFGLPPATTSLEQGQVPSGARQAKNSRGHAAYDGPCPPSGTHHYRFTVYALEMPLDLADGAGKEEALDAIGKQATAQGRLVGTFAA
jgi:Raf kinase inhibitor-like YbhB/YbcL family protein